MREKPTIKFHHCDPYVVVTTDGTMLYSNAAVTPEFRQRHPDLLMQSNIPHLREAAINTMHMLLQASIGLELFSLDEVFSTALERYNTPKDSTNDNTDDSTYSASTLNFDFPTE